MDAKSSAGVPLSSPAAAQRCAEGAGLDSGAPAAAQSAMPSIAFPAATAADRRLLSTKAAAPAVPQLQPRISTRLTDVTHDHAGKEQSAGRRLNRSMARPYHPGALTSLHLRQADQQRIPLGSHLTAMS
jgi:hypothetical protein